MFALSGSEGLQQRIVSPPNGWKPVAPEAQAAVEAARAAGTVATVQVAVHQRTYAIGAQPTYALCITKLVQVLQSQPGLTASRVVCVV